MKILKTLYVLIAELHTDGQKINRKVIRNLVNNCSQIGLHVKEESIGMLVKWSIEDGLM